MTRGIRGLASIVDQSSVCNGQPLLAAPARCTATALVQVYKYVYVTIAGSTARTAVHRVERKSIIPIAC